MSLGLDGGTQPEETIAATGPAAADPAGLWLQLAVLAHGVDFSGIDFAEMVKYWLTNTDLVSHTDPRIGLVRWAQRLVTIDGYNHSGRRLADIDELTAKQAMGCKLL